MRSSLIVFLATVLVLAASTESASAQTIALKLGAASSTITQSPDIPGDTLRSNRGVMGGISLTKPLGPRWGWQAEALLTRKGNRIVNGPAGIDSSLTLDYLEVPVLGTLRLTSGHSMVVRVHAGPAVAFKLRRNETGFDQPLPEDQQIKIKNVDVGMAIGAEIERRSLILGARYTIGVSNIFDDVTALYGVERLANRALYVYGGWILRR